MINLFSPEAYFVSDFLNFERKRMYPPGYRKETTMTKPTQKHVSAIVRSVHLLESGLSDDLEKRFHKAIERDLNLMREVKQMLSQMIENPTLPFLDGPPTEPELLINPIEQEPDEAF